MNRFIHLLRRLVEPPSDVYAALDDLRLAIGRHESRFVRERTFPDIREAEFRVFSQWGEDGIIQYLLSKIPTPNRTFVEFGVQNYAESNTRFLMTNDNWRGVIIDASDAPNAFLAQRGLDWRHDIRVITAFITAENIDALLRSGGAEGDIGLLSIDVDGNDYWILQAIGAVSPRILVIEYNSIFGREHELTIPYRSDFVRSDAHPSNLYFGASLAAIFRLATAKGYRFVGSNSAGNDAFFVRADVAGGLPSPTVADAWVESRFRDSRDERGHLTLISSHADRLRLIRDLPVVDLRAGRERTIADVFGV
jgi:hypothetical protein